MSRRAIGAAAALLIGGCSTRAAPAKGFELDPPLPRPSFTLTDDAGRSYPFFSRTAGHPTFLFFGYTSCPDVCPDTMADVSVALQHVAPDVRKSTIVVFVTTDARHDKPSILREWLHSVHPTGAPFVGLTGTQVQIDAAQQAAHVMLATDGGKTHAASVLLFGADDYARTEFLQSTDEATQMASALAELSPRRR